MIDPQHDETVCSKRLWVLNVLTDDESGAMTPMLAMHLSQCQECQALAQSLQDVTAALNEDGMAEPPTHLHEMTAGRLREALTRGAALSGRSTSPRWDDAETTVEPAVLNRHLRVSALAAAVLISVGLAWFATTRTPDANDSPAIADGPARPAVQPTVSPAPDATSTDSQVARATETPSSPTRTDSLNASLEKLSLDEFLDRRLSDTTQAFQFGPIPSAPPRRGNGSVDSPPALGSTAPNREQP